MRGESKAISTRMTRSAPPIAPNGLRREKSTMPESTREYHGTLNARCDSEDSCGNPLNIGTPI